MIYDRIDSLDRYEGLSPLMSAVAAYVQTQSQLPQSVQRIIHSGNSQTFSGSLVAQRKRMLLHYVKEGSEVIAFGYAEQAKAQPSDGQQEIYLSDGQAATVITVTVGMFVLLMPGEPYALALSGSSDGFDSESLLFE